MYVRHLGDPFRNTSLIYEGLKPSVRSREGRAATREKRDVGQVILPSADLASTHHTALGEGDRWPGTHAR